jgi:MOSC domain-containing protein YiiM
LERRRKRGWVKRFTIAGRPGAYLRVVRNGKITAGDQITVISSSVEGAPTISDVFAANA